MVGTFDKVELAVQDWGTVKHPKTGETQTVKKYVWKNSNKVQIEVSKT